MLVDGQNYNRLDGHNPLKFIMIVKVEHKISIVEWKNNGK